MFKQLKNNVIYGWQVDWQGASVKNLNEKELREKVCICINRATFYTDITQIVINLKSIFANYEDISLNIFIKYFNKEIRVNYSGDKLVYFEEKERLAKNKELKIIYKTPLNFHTCLLGEDLDEEKLEYYEEKIKEVTQQILKLESIPIIKLRERDKKICQYYRLFYNEIPDFCSENIGIKIQAMLCILLQFNISLGYKFDWDCFRDITMPFSIKLQYDIERLFPLGKIEESIEVSNKQKNTIRIIGEFVQEYTNNRLKRRHYQNEEINKLLQLSRMIYLGNFNLLCDLNVEKLIKGIGNEELGEHIKLVRKINQKIEEMD